MFTFGLIMIGVCIGVIGMHIKDIICARKYLTHSEDRKVFDLKDENKPKGKREAEDKKESGFSKRLLSNKIGQKGKYSIFQNMKDEIMIDARIGKPENPLFIYDGGDAALLYRSPKSSIVLRNIEPQACKPLKSVTTVLVVEIGREDVEREYVADVRIVKNIKNLYTENP